MPPSHDFHKIDAKTTKIGVIGSPSQTTDIKVDILSHAIDQRLVGALTYFNYNQDSAKHIALGQVTEITLSNPWVQDPTMRSIIRQKGKVDPVTGRQDTHTAEMSISAVFADDGTSYDQSELGTIPATGTEIKAVNNDLLDHLLEEQSDRIFKIGRFYGTDTYFPAWFRHFGDPATGGVGEAYHFGVFGKTGSGKSVLAKVMLLGYATNPEMSLFIIDPQGEFYKDFQPGERVHAFLTKNLNRTVEALNVQDLFLTDSSRYEFFMELLNQAGFFNEYRVVSEENRERAKFHLQKILGQRSKEKARAGTLTSFEPKKESTKKKIEIKPWTLVKREVFDHVWARLGDDDVIAGIYSGAEYQDRLRGSWEAADDEQVYEIWKSVAGLFTRSGRPNARKLKDLVAELLEAGSGKTVVVSLSEQDIPKDLFWNEEVKMLVIERLLSELKHVAELAYKEEKYLNTLVVMDEAHRLAPKHVPNETESIARIREFLLDAVRTTRKQGLGWGFISQTLNSLHAELTMQLRIYIFGYGLGWGSEYRALEQLIGGPSLKLYKSFRDPESSLKRANYPFMASGPLSPLAFSGSPMYFTALNWKTGEPFDMFSKE